MHHGHPSSDRQVTASITELVQRLHAVDQTLPEALEAQILTTGSAVVPHLIAILEETLSVSSIPETQRQWLHELAFMAICYGRFMSAHR